MSALEAIEHPRGRVAGETRGVPFDHPSEFREDRDVPVGHGCVQAVLRALSILRCIARDQRGMTLTEVVRGTGLAPSTAHRLLTTLQSEGFVQFETTASRWFVGPSAHLVGIACHPQRRQAFS
ncbi:helix-turn-helix domain-containing protein [Labrys sp. KNU-23]|uniref:helix-turn-helix domain-containing protein n=1 Tax=Labrys sp. KNU-23 TaxID=2789216 RepID=UPI0011EE3687|nr:helix-turn-helix domain-containing protein [Labrys sp. KNU-23]QEN88169.1 helix-turn-helix domain-containing protein [Labrys sp. KNU-23]